MPRRLLLGVFLLALYAPTSSSQGINVTDRFEALGDPISGFYSNPDSKSTLYDLQAFDGKIYVGHGSTNASEHSRLIYFDPARGRFDADRNDDGSYVAIAEEGLNPLRVYDGELHVGSLDPNGGGTHFTRKRNGRWSSRDVAPDAHNRDLYKFGGRYFMHHGRNTTTYPNVLISSDDGASFQTPVQPNISTASVGYAKFFEFQGSLYFTQIGEPYLSRYTGNDAAPFEAALRSRAELIAGSKSNVVMEDATEIGSRLVFNSNGRLYTASSLTTEGVSAVSLPGLAGLVPFDIVKRDGTMYVFVGGGGTYAVASTVDGVTFREVARFTTSASLVRFELLGSDFYFGGRRALYRVRQALGTVEVLNVAPTAVAVASVTSGVAPLAVRFDAGASRDSDGSIVAYEWTFGDGTTGTGAVVDHAYATPGTYSARVLVRDDKGATATSASITITAEVRPNAAPTAVGVASVTSGVAPLAVRFDAGASRDSDGSIVAYEWTFGDGATATGAVVNYTYNAAGTYSARVLVRDNQGATATSATITITALAPPPPPPPPVEGTAQGAWVGSDVGSATDGSERWLSASALVVRGGGHDIWDTRDGFRFVQQPLPGDGVLVVRVTSQQNTDGWAKAGLMLRAGLTASSAHVLVAMTPSNGITFNARLADGGTTAQVQGPRPNALPVWLRLERRGEDVTASWSADGATWTRIAAAKLRAGTASGGLAVLSHKLGTLSEVNADNFSLKNTAALASAAGLDGATIENAEVLAFGLRGNYPNPFGRTTTIRYGLDEAAPVRLEVYNALGQRVAVLVDETKAAGAYEAAFEAEGLPAGVYLYRLSAGGRTVTGLMTMAR